MYRGFTQVLRMEFPIATDSTLVARKPVRGVRFLASYAYIGRSRTKYVGPILNMICGR